MKTEKNILIAFLLNFAFSVFEFAGGIYTGSVAIISDAVHDIGDAITIGLSFILEKKSKKQPDSKFTYGYGRYAVFGSFITTLILLYGSLVVIYNAIGKIISPTEIKYNGMIIFAIVGVCVNFFAAFFTREKGSINQKAVNLHMIEDVLGWAVVLVGAIIMKFTGFILIDPLMSVAVALFILINAIINMKEISDIFLEKIPGTVNINEIKDHISDIEGVIDVHHIHIWSMDGQNKYATMHIVTNAENHKIKDVVRKELNEHGIIHATLELEAENEHCHEKACIIKHTSSVHHH